MEGTLQIFKFNYIINIDNNYKFKDSFRSRISTIYSILEHIHYTLL